MESRWVLDTVICYRVSCHPDRPRTWTTAAYAEWRAVARFEGAQLSLLL